MNLYESLGDAAINSGDSNELNKLILKSENFIDDVLHKDLRERKKIRDGILQDMFDMEMLIENLNLFMNTKDPNILETLTSLGCDTYVYADIIDKNKIFVNAGFEFYLEMTIVDAIIFLKKKLTLYEEKLKFWNKKIATTKAHIQILMQAISSLTSEPLSN